MNYKRGYVQGLRAQQTVEREERILDEAERLFGTLPFDRVALSAVAQAAGVTIPTLQRRFGNKEGLFTACGERIRARVGRQRGAPPIGNVRGSIVQLIDHYELEGRLTWQLLRQEDDIPFLKRGLDYGRGVHRAWVEQVFAEPLARSARGGRQPLTDALVAATDVFVWKLLRLDFGRSRKDVEATILAMVEAIVGAV
jgi:AcrR family transcriptional regulator